jgi:serine-type D-Ala-D-Ala carboxypeptidase
MKFGLVVYIHLIRFVLKGFLFFGVLWIFNLEIKSQNAENNRGNLLVFDFSAIDKKINSWIDSGYYSGASLIIVKDSKTVYRKCFGNYSFETVNYIASAGKWLGAATIAAVVDEGKLSWNDSAKKWLPQFTNALGNSTLRQLLSHISGFLPYQPEGKPVDKYQTLKQSVDSIIQLPNDTLPGTKFNYGGLAMQVAGRMAELATGKEWETLFQEKIGRPLLMDYTHFTPVDLTPGHSPMIGGGARSTVQDYIRFLEMIANNGVFEGNRVLSAQSIQEMQTDQIGEAKVKMPEFPMMTRGAIHRSIYGLGEWREELDSAGNATLISSPGWAGAYPWIDKKYNVYGFLLTHVSKASHGFSSFMGSPVIPLLVRDAIDQGNALDVKKGWIKLDGGKLYYEELGHGEPLILIHGHSLDNTMWDDQFREFAKYYRVIRYDCRGYGQSSMPDEKMDFLHANDLKELMSQLQISKAHLVGLSMGGFIALDFLALHPEKVISAVLASGNIWNAKGPDSPWTDRERVNRRIEIQEMEKKGIDVYKRNWYQALMNSAGSQKDRIRYSLWKMIYEWDAWQLFHCEPRLLLGTSVISRLKQYPVSIPVMVLEGKSSNNHFPEHQQVLDLIPGSNLEVIDDAGHMMNMERPVEFNKVVIDFVKYHHK